MSINQSTSLVIKEHDFQEAKNSLKKYTEQARKEVEVSRVPYDGGLFNLGDHKVTGAELNRITSQIQDYLISLNTLSQGLVDEFGQVYKAFEYLDKDYITGIVASIKAAEEVSKQEQKDRKDIKELVGQHEQSVAVLKKFKADIDKLKHLTDIDKAWELIEKQSKLVKEFGDYMADLSKLKHLKDVDSIYADFEKLKKDFSKLSDTQSKYVTELKTVREYCDSLSKIQHIKDIDKLWNKSAIVTKDIQNVKKSLENQSKMISDFNEVLQCMQEAQQQFIDKVNQLISDFREDFSNKVRSFTEVQTAKLNDIEHNYADAIDKLSIEQREKLASIEKSHNDALDSITKKQALVINKIEKTQVEKLEQLSDNQSAILEQIANDQFSKLAEISRTFEEEKAVLNERINVLTQKVKLLYFVAGGVAAFTVIQLFLNIWGVI